MTASDANGTTSRTVRSSGPILAEVVVPPSKSIANRALVCAALADGASMIDALAPGDDTAAMLDCLAALGVEVSAEQRRADPAAIGTAPVSVEVEGNRAWFQRSNAGGERGSGAEDTDGEQQAGAPAPIELPVRLAGTTSRFVTALAALGSVPVRIDGLPPLRARPMGPLHNALTALGVSVVSEGEPGHLPATVTGPPRRTDAVVMPGDVSSQFVTALMLIAPLLPGGLTIALTTPLVSRPYVEITAAVMDAFGAVGITVGDRRIVVPPGDYYATDFEVEPDASTASYVLALPALVGGSVCVRGLGPTALQGDARFVELLAEMGCTVSAATDTVVMRHPDAPLRGIDVDMSDISDLVPTLAVIATQADTPTTITGVGFIRHKESDRLGDLAHELGKLGADVSVLDDGLRIVPTSEPLRPARLETHHDHRLAMAFGVLGLAVDGIEVVDPGVVSKSWPEFWEVLDRLQRRALDGAGRG